jgi:hypothetical protein
LNNIKKAKYGGMVLGLADKEVTKNMENKEMKLFLMRHWFGFFARVPLPGLPVFSIQCQMRDSPHLLYC